MHRSMFIASLTIVLAASIIPAGDWYHWRGPWQNGVSPETGLPSSWSPEGENLIWKAPYGSRSTPLILNGRVYFINYLGQKETIQERVMCLDADTGKFIWEHKFNVWHSDIVTSRLGWTNLAGDPKTGYIYAHGTQGMLFCFDKNGKVVWSHSLGEEYGRISGYGGRLCSPIVDEDLVIIGMLNSAWGDLAKGGNRFVAMDKMTGAVRWWSEPSGAPKDTYYSVPVVAVINGQRQLVSGTADGSVVGMQVRTGKKLWGHKFSTSAINISPVIDGNLVYISHGEENPDNNVKGQILCVDASQIDDKGQPKIVWRHDGVKARWSSPILKDGRVYFADEIAKLYCFDAKTGAQQWRFDYGANARGSPVWADGKIFVGEVNSVFHILQPGDKKCTRLHEQFFVPLQGDADVEINGSPAVANGRVYLTTSDETYCIGKKGAKAAAEPDLTPAPNISDPPKITQVQVIPGDVVLHPGEKFTFKLKFFDALGWPVEPPAGSTTTEIWSLPAPPPPPGAKTNPPPLTGTIAPGGELTVDAKKPSQQGYVQVKIGEVVGKARVRVAARLPFAPNFKNIPVGAAPGGWVNTQGKFIMKSLDGRTVLAKVNDKSSPLIARGNAYIGLPTYKDYTIQAELQGTKVGNEMPDMGVVANRYTLILEGNNQKLRIVSWDALPRVDTTVPFAVHPGVWYHLKLTVEVQGDKGTIKGKAWPREGAEPVEWLVLHDPRPNTEGAPAVYGYVKGIVGTQPGTEIYYDNVSITPNAGASVK